MPGCSSASSWAWKPKKSETAKPDRPLRKAASSARPLMCSLAPTAHHRSRHALLIMSTHTACSSDKVVVKSTTCSPPSVFTQLTSMTQ